MTLFFRSAFFVAISLILLTATACSTAPRYAEVFISSSGDSPPTKLKDYCEAVGQQTYSATYTNVYNDMQNGARQGQNATTDALVSSLIGMQAGATATRAKSAAVANCMKSNGFTLKKLCVSNCQPKPAANLAAQISPEDILRLIDEELEQVDDWIANFGEAACYDGLQTLRSDGMLLVPSHLARVAGFKNGDELLTPNLNSPWKQSGFQYRVGDKFDVYARHSNFGDRQLTLQCSHSVTDYRTALLEVKKSIVGSDYFACASALKEVQVISGMSVMVYRASKMCKVQFGIS